MLIYVPFLFILIIVCKNSAENLKNPNEYEEDKSDNQPLIDQRPFGFVDDTFKPKAFDAYMQMMRNRIHRIGACNGYRCNVKQMIKDGKLLSNGLRSKKEIKLPLLFPLRNRRASNLKFKDEIDSIKIFPIESNGTKTIECQKLTDEEISCRQDDFEYKIKLKHKDLPQESLESLIRSLYIRLSSCIPIEKKKRSEVFTAAPSTNNAPFMIVLPALCSTTPPALCPSEKDEDATEWPYKPCKQQGIYLDAERSKSATHIPIDQMVIECSPRDFDPVNPNEPRNFIDEQTATTKAASAYIYSCRWQGKRQVETQNIVVPLKENSNIRPSRQSFKIIINPSEASANSLPISIAI